MAMTTTHCNGRMRNGSVIDCGCGVTRQRVKNARRRRRRLYGGIVTARAVAVVVEWDSWKTNNRDPERHFMRTEAHAPVQGWV